MPKLAENVLIGGVVRLAGENVSDADAKNIRADAFVSGGASEADEKADQPRSVGKRTSAK